MIEWRADSGFATLETRQWFPRPLDRVFPFFANAANLQRITPPWLSFRIVGPTPVAMRVGSRISYRLRLRGLPLRWQSEITVWDPPRRFVDEQRRGPYRLWTHEHEFAELDGGTEVRDVVRYAVPGGSLVDRPFVRGDLRRIFAYRARSLREILG